MLTSINWQNASELTKQQVLQRPGLGNPINEAVSTIIDKIRFNGDEALIDLTRQFDGVSLTSFCIGNNIY